jgi:tripartite-type tricarboxylate transporter receptor subunit TctC
LQLPTLAETVAPGFDTGTWFGLYGPRGLPPEITARLNAELLRFAASPSVLERFTQLTFELATATPAELTALQARDAASWARIIRDAGVRVE